MLKKEIKKLPQSRIEITVTVAWEDWQKMIEPAAEELTRDLKIPGFRPGKAPLHIAEQKTGKTRIIEKAAEMSIGKTYPRIVSEEKLETLGSPQAEIVKAEEGSDLEYRVVSAVVPEVEIGEWKEAVRRVNREYEGKSPTVEESDLDQEIQKIRNTRAKLITVSRPAQNEDSVLVDFTVSRDGVVIENGTSRNHPLVLGKGIFIPGFEEQLVGMKEGDEKEFQLTFPSEYHAKHLAGKAAGFKVKMNLVQERQLPDLDDAFAQSLGKFESLEAFKKNIREGLLEERKLRQKEERRTKIIDILVEKSRVDLPEILVHQEIHKMIDEFSSEIQSMGMSLEQYLDKIGKSPDELEKVWEPQAAKRVKAALLLEKMAVDQDIEVPAEEIEAEMNKTLQFYKNVKNVEKDIDMGRLYSYTKGILTNERVLAFLEKA